ncbi:MULTISPECIES: hypothetical protein, partial [Citrobacter]|uniref:hypothetical protein n=1 Tax=Citrobacter TaxID=544 RepID=UPI001C990E40
RRGSRVRVPSVPPLIESPELTLRAFSFAVIQLLLNLQKSSALYALFIYTLEGHTPPTNEDCD